MMETPLVSVIIPAYNCADCISGAIDSALRQEVPLEVLIIDDCSTDGLGQVLEHYAGHPEVSCWKNSENLGTADSRNRGVALAKGKFVAFLDADDLWADGKLKKQLAVMEGSDAVLCCTARELLTPEGVSTGRVIPVKEEITYRELLKHNSINCSSVLLRAEVAREFPMVHSDSHEDYIMWLQVLQKYGTARGINEPLLRYRLSTTGKSGSKLQSAKMTFMVYRYMGFSMPRSVCCFCSYAVHGVKKYLLSRKGKTQ